MKAGGSSQPATGPLAVLHAEPRLAAGAIIETVFIALTSLSWAGKRRLVSHIRRQTKHMSDDQSVTFWLEALKQGDERGASEIWDRYFDKLTRLARSKLQDSERRTADEEDVALSAFHSFCRGAKEGRFPQLEDRDNLWKLLVVITARKSQRLKKSNRREKRGGGKVRGESVFVGHNDDEGGMGIGQIIGSEPTPELLNLMAEQIQRLMSELRDDTLREVAVMKMEGYANVEIASKLEISIRSVERKMALIRTKWARETQP